MYSTSSARSYFERAYALRQTVPTFAEHVEEWQRLSDPGRFAEYRRVAARFGEHPRQKLELLKARDDGPGKGLAVFIHGGFWRAFELEQTRFMALPFLRRGWDCALTEYRLMPEFRLADLVADTGRALGHLEDLAETGKVSGNWLVAGHSAGAHLALHGLGAPDLRPARDGSTTLLLLSGVFDIYPVSGTSIGDDLRMDRKEVARWSIYGHERTVDMPIRFVVGAEETDDFRRQSYIAAQMLGIGEAENIYTVEGANHMTLLTRLATVDPVFDAVTGGLMGDSR